MVPNSKADMSSDVGRVLLLVGPRIPAYSIFCVYA